jgi:gas vesicle protein
MSMAEDNPPSTTGSAMEGILTEYNLPQILAGPAGKAICRLIAGVVDIPPVYLNSFTQGINASGESKALVNKEIAAAAAMLVAQNEGIAARSAYSLLAKEYRHQKNKENIIKKTMKLLGDDASAMVETDQTSSPQSVDEDWMNVFEKFAEDASTDRMQTLWARVLSAEIRQPKSFSLPTLRFIAELDQDIALLFEKYSPRICNHQIIPASASLEGPELTDLLRLQDAGLITGVGGKLSNIFAFDRDAIGIRNQGRIILIKGIVGSRLEISGVLTTRTGKELLKIFKSPFDMDSLNLIVRDLPKAGLKSISMLTPLPAPDQGSFMQQDLWAEPFLVRVA